MHLHIHYTGSGDNNSNANNNNTTGPCTICFPCRLHFTARINPPLLPHPHPGAANVLLSSGGRSLVSCPRGAGGSRLPPSLSPGLSLPAAAAAAVTPSDDERVPPASPRASACPLVTPARGSRPCRALQGQPSRATPRGPMRRRRSGCIRNEEDAWRQQPAIARCAPKDQRGRFSEEGRGQGHAQDRPPPVTGSSRLPPL